MNNSKSLVITGLFLLLIAAVSGLEVKKTEFIFNTDPYVNISVSVLNEETGEEVELFEGRARKFGEFRFTYYGTVDQVNLKAKIINNETGDVIKEETFGPYVLGIPSATMNFTLGEIGASEETVEETVPETTEVVSEEASENSPILGLVIGENGEFRKIYYYVSAGIIGLVILTVVLRKRLSTVKSGPVEPHPSKVIKKVKPSSKTEVVVPVVDKSNEENINDTEKRIADLQKQLEQIRNEERLAKLQKQLNLERQSLKKLQEETEEPKVNPSQNNNLDNQPKPF